MIDSRIITFITVAKTKNFTRASEILNLTQPGVYQQIQFLENHYGVKFIKKDGRSLKLTEEGQVYLCEICGNKVKIIDSGAGTLVCCGQDMTLIE